MTEVAVCSWWDESGRWRSELSGYARGLCPLYGDYHTATIVIDDEGGNLFPDDRYPAACACGYAFSDGDFSGHSQPYWRSRESSAVLVLSEALPIGALHVTPALRDPDGWPGVGDDGLAIMCKTPGGWWYIDARASNCTLRNDNVHHCWVRHGTVGETLHIDKNGATCAAGAGSIVIGSWHGFLHHGKLVT